MNATRISHMVAAASLIALVFLCLSWELWWAPLRPGGSLLALKALPLLLPLFGILRGKHYTFQWSSMFLLLYLMEGLVRASSEHGVSRLPATIETLLALMFIIGAVSYTRLSRSPTIKATN